MNIFVHTGRYWIVGLALSLTACGEQAATTANIETTDEQLASVEESAQCDDLYLTNGRFFAMAELPTTEGDTTQPDFNSMHILDNRILEVGDDLVAPDCAEVVELAGSTVIPGLIDSHMHFIRATLRPGYDTRQIELSRSIPEAMAMVTAKAEAMAEAGVSTDQWITFVGGWDPIQWQENVIGSSRDNEPYTVFPSLQQLNDAAGDYPVYIHLRSTEEAFSNRIGIEKLKAMAVASNEPVDLKINDETGLIGDSTASFVLLKTTSDPRDQAIRVMQGFNSVGLTSVVDVGGSIRGRGAQYFSVFDDFQTIGELYDEDALTIRVRSRVQGDQITPLSDYAALVQERQTRFGSSSDSMFKIIGIGEDLGNVRQNGYQETVEMALSNDWTVGKHAGRAADIELFHDAASTVGSATRLSLEHSKPGQEEIDLIREYGYEKVVGANLGVHAFLGRGRAGSVCNGTPYKSFPAQGLMAGIGSDSTNAQPSNPWVHVYHMVTGLDVKGFAANGGGVLSGAGEDLVCPDERISRAQAIQLFTQGSSWLAFSENDIGTLESGKLADLVVLNNDLFSGAVSDEDIILTKSILTLVDGKIVYFDDSSSISINNE